MKVTTLVPKEWTNCDGCDYTIGRSRAMIDDGVTLDQIITELRIPWPHSDDGFATFHFHGPHHDAYRHDCFRYWAHNVSIMQRSLKNRGWSQEQTDEFMAMHLYRPALGGSVSQVVVVAGPAHNGSDEIIRDPFAAEPDA